jgi:hypothetical protein
MCQKGVQRHTASPPVHAFLHEKSYPRVGFFSLILRTSQVPAIVPRCSRLLFLAAGKDCTWSLHGYDFS